MSQRSCCVATGAKLVVTQAEQAHSMARQDRSGRGARGALRNVCAGAGFMLRGAALAVLSVLAFNAWADPHTAADSPRTDGPGQSSSKPVESLPQITVEAQRQAIKRTVDTFVASVTRAPAGSTDDTLPRWQAPICPLVAGLPRAEGEFILARLSEIIEAAGAPLAPSKCQPNFYVVVTPNPEQLLKKWSARSDRPFGDWPKTIREFIEVPRPVRVWYNAEVVSADDEQPLSVGADLAGTAFANVLVNKHASFSRIEFGDVRDFQSVIAIVDISRLSGLEWGQVADYVAMAGLAKVDPDAGVANAPTILSLFGSSAAATAAGLTAWDKSFLKALYHTRQNVRGQRTEIAEHILNDVAP